MMSVLLSCCHFYVCRPKIAYVLTVIIAVAIMILSLTPLEQLPDAPGSDKWHHFIAYGALALPLSFLQIKRLWIALLLAMTLGGMIEIIQPYANRYGEWGDFAANGAGVMMGAILGLFFSRWYHKALWRQGAS